MTFVRGNRGPRTTQQPPGFRFQPFSLSEFHLLLLAAFCFQLVSLSVFQTMRPDRFITLNLVHPWRRVFRALNPQSSTLNPKWSVPILMYHSVSDDPEPGVSPYYRVNTSPSVFRQHMQFLAGHGYQTISLNQLVSMLTIGQQDHRTTGPQDQGTTRPRGPISAFQLSSFSAFPKKPVVLTFDDGFRNFYTEAFPTLQEFGFTAAMFLPTAFIGDTRRQFRLPGTTLSALNSQLSTRLKECLIWPEIRELRKSGIEFGSHTVSHAKLVELDWPDIKAELSASKSEIERHLGELVTTFCCPFAFPSADRDFIHRFTELLSDTGYRSCATTELGRVRTGDDPFRLRRLPANSLDDPALFQAKLDGAYDWLGRPQGWAKRLKSCLGISRPQTTGYCSLSSVRC